MKHSFLLSIIFLILSCSTKNKRQVENTTAADTAHTLTITPATFKAAHIMLGKITEQPLGASLKLNGMLDVPPQNLISIAAPLGGYIQSTDLLQGMKVKKGQLLAKIESTEFIQLQQDYLENKSKLEFLEAEYSRQQELAKENVNAQKSLQQAKSQFQTTQATVKGLKARLSMIHINVSQLENSEIRQTLNIISPIDGFVTVVSVNVGQYVTPTTVMFEIVNIEHIHAELQVYEKDIRKISVGQKVTFQLNHETGSRTASVYLIGKEISDDRTVRIHCHLDKEDESLLPGMFVTASIETSMREATVLPVKALVSFEGKDYVFARMNSANEFELIPVEIGNSNAEFTEVKMPAGFEFSRDIVVDGAFALLGIMKNNQEE